DTDVPVMRLRAMDELVARSFSGRHLSLALLGAFAVMALLLAGVGIHGVMSYTVSRRTREIGLRMALGARGGDVLRLVLGQALRVTILGVVAGTLGALALRRLVASMLYGVGAGDPATFALVALLPGLLALAAGYLSARRASRVEPAAALRAE